MKATVRGALAIWVASWACSDLAIAQKRSIDAAKSVMTVRVYKAGLLSAMGHDHEIAAPISSGTVDATARRVELHAKTGAMKVLDARASEKDRAEIQNKMLGPDVLDAQNHPEIVFTSTSAEPAGAGSWKVLGNLTLHGQTRTVAVEVRENGEYYVGTSRFKQTEFAIQPVKVAGGAIKVKDEVLIEFKIQLAR